MTHSRISLDAVADRLLARPGIFELDGDSLLIGKVKAGYVFYDSDTQKHCVEVAGVAYEEFNDRTTALRYVARRARRWIPRVREFALASFKRSHPYLSQLMDAKGTDNE